MTAKERFKQALSEFIEAGNKLVEAWDGDDGFNADVAYGVPVSPTGQRLFPISMDEWLLELQGHFES